MSEEKQIDDGGPAYPTNEAHGCPFPGMNLRDWFAGQALAGDSANPDGGSWGTDIPREQLLGRCRLYYHIADAMIRARKAVK